MSQAILQTTEIEQQIEIFRALSEPIRVEIISLFDQDGMCACTDLEKTLPIAKSTISYHIKNLAQAGLISVHKDGRNYHYSLRIDVFDHFLPGFVERLRDDRAPRDRLNSEG